MNKYALTSLLAILLGCAVADAQIGVMIGPRFGYGRPQRRSRPQPRQDLPKFQPTVNLSLGYGFPNLDALQLADFYGQYKGSTTQTGPFSGAIDYQYSRTSSIGLLVTHGTASIPYYNYNGSSTTPAFTGAIDSWAVMLNFVRYMPVAGDKISPYIRTAIGINVSTTQTYTDPSGNNLYPGATPTSLAYQFGLGAKFNLTKNTGLFLEAGYGKYILQGGLAFKL